MLSACSSTETETADPVPTTDVDPIRETLKPEVFSGDGFPKVSKVFKTVNGIKLPKKTLNDFNGDGRVDFIQEYNTSGEWIERESADLNGDGVLDVVYIYSKAPGQKQAVLIEEQFLSRLDGRISVHKFYKNGKLVRREMDRRNAGKTDLWEYYDGGRLVKVEKDDTGDGIPDSQPKFRKIVE